MNESLQKKLDSLVSWRLHKVSSKTVTEDLMRNINGAITKEEVLCLMEHPRKVIYRFRISNKRWFYHTSIERAVDMATEDYRKGKPAEDELSRERREPTVEEFVEKYKIEVIDEREKAQG